MAEENKPGGDLNDIRSQTDDLLKSLDSLDKAPKSSPKSSSTRSKRDSSPAKPPAQKSSSSSVNNILVAAGSLVGIAVVIIGGLLALEASKQATLSREAELAKRLAPFKTGTPLTDEYPTLEQIERFLSSWLNDKSLTLEGKEPSVPLSTMARSHLIEAIDRQVAYHKARGSREEIFIKLRKAKILERSPVRISVAATITYSDKLWGPEGSLISSTPEMLLRNIYILGRHNRTWKLVAFKPEASQ